jgi:hypothetical protein
MNIDNIRAAVAGTGGFYNLKGGLCGHRQVEVLSVVQR